MRHQFSPWFHLQLSSIVIFFIIPLSLFAADDQYNACLQSFDCGSIQNITYPFWGNPLPDYCGVREFKLECQDGFPVLLILSEKFRVLQMDLKNQILRLTRVDLYDNTCPLKFVNTTLSYLFSYTPDFGNLTLFYGCSSASPAPASNKFSCHKNNHTRETVYYTIGSIPNEHLGNCNVSITVPVLQTAVKALMDNTSSLTEVLNEGFDVQWIVDDTACSECAGSGGRCGYNISYFQPICFCPDRPYLMRCPALPGSKLKLKNKILIAAIVIGVCIIAVTAVVIGCWRRKFSWNKPRIKWKKKIKDTLNIEAFLEKCGSFAPKRYSYSDVKKMTDNFRDKLGQGGYGDVYKGKLHDGHLVAVKLLMESKDNREEFLNEVASISRTAHVNIVTLLGFCFEGHKRAVVYDLMRNGSLEKYIYGESQSKKIPPLGLERICQIAIGIAHGLDYLHRGCNTQILHLDIKPQNILLDQDFRPKISDFGLARLCNRKESTMSMFGARGTVGYIAPEVFSRNFGVVSHKSDVYSFGMMILEMIGARKNTEAGADHSSEIYFPHWIHDRIESEEDLKLHWSIDNAEEEVTRKMILVGLWCIQTNPANRPSMDKVVDMLEGNHEVLQVPPKPFPSSPQREPASGSTTSSTRNHYHNSQEAFQSQ